MNLVRKNTFLFKYKEPQIDILKALNSKVTQLKHTNFQVAYVNILDRLIEKVDLGAIITLAQYYDAPLQCFTFLDFQIVNTLEKFEIILGRTIKDDNPFPKLEENFTLSKIALALGLDVQEVLDNWATKGMFKGFTRMFLEDHAWEFLKFEKWNAF